MKKKIMFIGAGPYQLPGTKRAKEMGLFVIAVDRNPNAPGFKLANIHVALDVKDVKGCLRVAKENGIDGVLTIASDIAVPTVAAVAKELKLPGISPEVAQIATNKALMRKRFAERGLPSPKFRIAVNLVEAQAAIKILGLPVVIKPTDNAGSRGVSTIEHPDEIEKAFDHAIKNSREGILVIEEFMDGIECTIEAMTYNRRTEILAISQKKKPDGFYRVATDLTYPPDFPEKTISDIETVMKQTIEAMGIDMGPTHSEVIVTKDGPKLVEVAARGGGFDIFSKIIPLASGVDAITESIKISIGIAPDITPKYRKGVVLRFFAPPPGILKRIDGLDEVRSIKNAEVGFFKNIGDIVPVLATDGDRTGYIIAWGDTREIAVQTADLIEEKVEFETEAAGE